MPAKTAAKTNKATTTKKVASAAKKSVSKGDALVCNVCGMSVVIEQIGDVEVRRETELFCCDEPMKKKSTKAAATKKKPAAAKK